MKENIKNRKVFSAFLKIKPFSYYKIRRGKNREKLKNEALKNIKEYKYKKFNKNVKFEIQLIFFFKNYPKRIDVDNLLKPVLDCFSGLVYKDDNQIFKLISEKRYNQLIEGISVDIWPIK